MNVMYDNNTYISVKVNRKYVSIFSKTYLNAIAFAAVVRAYEKNTNTNKAYTVNSLHELTGIHAKTIKKYITALSEIGLVGYDGKSKIRILSIKSSHREHNVSICIEIGSKAFKDAKECLIMERFTNRLRQIEHYRNELSRYNDRRYNPKSNVTLKEYKKLSRWLRDHCRFDYRTCCFTDHGWAYKNIAKYIGTSVMTAVTIVKKMIESGKIIKERVFSKTRIDSEYQRYFSDYTFIYKGYSYSVHANRYSLCTGII